MPPVELASSNLPQLAQSDEAALRRDLAAAYRLIARFKMADLIETHISVKLPAAQHFLINPYGLLFEEITASSLVKLNLQGEIVEPTASPINPAGFVIHSAIYPARPDVGCVLHTHSPYVMAVSALECGLLPLCQIGLQFYNRVAYHDYEGVSLDLDEQERLVEHLADKPIMLMRNHGLLSVGRNLAAAFHRAYYMEKACEVQIRAQSAHSKLIELAPEVCEKSARQQEDENLGALQWQALTRLLDRTEPGYQD